MAAMDTSSILLKVVMRVTLSETSSVKARV